VDDNTTIEGATQMGVLNKKAGKALEMINWMRNHASPAHNNDDSVSKEDVIGLAMILKSNLFDIQLPDPTHSPVSLLEQIKSFALTGQQIELFKEQINGFSSRDIRTVFGFGLDAICKGDEPEYSNMISLFSNIWDKATDELKTNMGLRLHNYIFDKGSDTSDDGAAKERVYDMLIVVEGIKYIPESTRASIYRNLAKKLAEAKDTSYGWHLENAESRALKQLGPYVPSIAFEDVYQEILSVWCGNYWGRSDASEILCDFIFNLSPKKQMDIIKLFETNERVRDELSQNRPKGYALSLLNEIRSRLTNQSQIAEVDKIIQHVKDV